MELQSTIQNLKISNLIFSVARLIKKDKLQHLKSRKGQKKNSMQIIDVSYQLQLCFN